MKTYATMKNSGVAWLGDIPADWQQKHTKYLFEQVKESVGSDPSQYELLSLTLRGIIPRSQVEGGKNPENYDTYQVVNNNDLVMCLFDYDVTPRTVGRATQTGMVTGAYTNLRPLSGVSSRYYNYFFLALDTTKELLHLCTGLRNGLSKPTFFTLNLPVPDTETQERIADYLDEETALIDDLIAKQQRLLELLEEKRRATITRAVTRGLNPNVELKDTGIEWLGKVPAHWELKKLKNTITSQKNGVWGSDADGGENDINCIRVADFDRYNLRVGNGKFTQRSIENKDRQGRLLSRGDLLFEKSGGGDNQLVGQVVKYNSDEPAVTSNFVARLTVANGYDVDFLVFLHAALYYQRINYRSIKQTSGIQNIDSQAYFNEFVGVPSLDEQEKIARHLLNENELVENLNIKINKQIDLLKERRTSLISSAVTGKVKV